MDVTSKISPIFVTEILAEILLHTIYQPEPPEWNRHLASRIPTRADPPWPFLLVCKFWREITLSTPSLWATFVVAINNDPTFPEVAHLPSILNAHLHLSRKEPLTLTINWTSSSKGYSPDDPSNTDPLLPLVNLVHKAQQTQGRWADVDIYAHLVKMQRTSHPHNSLPSISFDLRLSEMTQLKHLKIDSHSRIGLGSLELTPSPLLESLSVVGSRSLDISYLESFPSTNHFSSLTTITWHRRTLGALEELSYLLRHAPNVQRLDVRFGASLRAPQYNPKMMAELPMLRNTCISSTWTSLIAWFLKHFSAPLLERLKLKRVRIYRDNLSELAGVLRLSPLTDLVLELRWYSQATDNAHFLDFVHSLGHLRRLKVYTHRNQQPKLFAFVQDLTAVLQSSSPPEQILPNLTSTELCLDHNEFLGNDNNFSIAFVKDFILACRRKYLDEFRVSISFTTPPTGELDIGDLLRNDPEILGCVSESFIVTVDRK